MQLKAALLSSVDPASAKFNRDTGPSLWQPVVA